MSTTAKSRREDGVITVRVSRRDEPDFKAIRRGVLDTAIARLRSESDPSTERETSCWAGGSGGDYAD